MTTDGQILAAAREIGPEVADRSEEIERGGALPVDVIELMRPPGLFRMYVPGALGGPGVDAWESLAVMEELAYHDGAAGWCSMIGSTTSLLASFLEPGYASEIFGDPAGIAGGFAMPVGRAVAVSGGLRVTGRWQWGSGTRHSNWIGGGCLVVDPEGTPEPRSDGLIAPFVFFPAAEVRFIDNWDVVGLSGTGSGDYTVDDVFVPEGRWVQVGIDPPVLENPLSRFSFFGLLACGVASCALGIGRRALDEFVALAQHKKPQGGGRTLAERSRSQAEVARSEAKLAAAWSFMDEVVSSAWATATRAQTPTTEQKRRLRLAATHATQVSSEVAEAMYRCGGGAAVYRTSPLQRTFRDAFVATQHAMVAERTFDMVGRLRLGLDTDTALL